MDETRRNLIKGMLTGGTLLALGIPTITHAVSTGHYPSSSTQIYQLLLGNTPIDEAFAKGAQVACAAYNNYCQGALPAIQLEDELLTNTLRIVDLLTKSSDMRWIAVMDYASAAIFTELVRNSEGRLLSLGSHTFATSDNTPLPLRHVWTTASPAYSAGGLLASMLIHNQHSFSIVENFLTQTLGDSVLKDASLSEFSSYRSANQPTTRLHCGGMSPREASQLIGWKTSGDWESLFSRAIEFSIYRDEAASYAAIEYPQFDDWIEATGYAVVTTALGMGTNQESCFSRAFVHRLGLRNPNHHELEEKHFVSFVIDM